jgi:hypothetical protein
MRIDISQNGDAVSTNNQKVESVDAKVFAIKKVGEEAKQESKESPLKQMLLGGYNNEKSQNNQNSGVIINGNNLTVFCIESSTNNIHEKTLLSSDLTSIVFMYLLEQNQKVNDNLNSQNLQKIAYLNYLKTFSGNAAQKQDFIAEHQIEMDFA